MAKRWPPILGLTGFDGGAKPAISLATRTGRLQGGEGAETFDRGPGACCYNDGTCDDISQFDCISAGGQWRGPGTTCADVPNPCVGACCEPGCVENTTPDGCALDGGTFQGFGTTCDPDPCVGACCNGGVCTPDITEPDCVASGGVFQGAGSNCVSNPCNLPPCSCGFDAFDGSGRKFLTQTRTMSYTEANAASGFGDCTCNTEGSATWTRQYNPDTCELSCSCTGSVNRHDDVHHINDCSDTLSSCSNGFDPYNPGTASGTPESLIGCTSLTCGACCSYTLSLGTDTPTMRTFSFVGVGCCAASGTLTVTLSDECAPEFSPPP